MKGPPAASHGVEVKGPLAAAMGKTVEVHWGGGTSEVEACRVAHRGWLIGQQHVGSGGHVGRRSFGGGSLGGGALGRARAGMRSNTEGKGSVLKMRGCKYSEYHFVLGSNFQFRLLNHPNNGTAAFKATQYQFQILRLNTYIQTGFLFFLALRMKFFDLLYSWGPHIVVSLISCLRYCIRKNGC